MLPSKIKIDLSGYARTGLLKAFKERQMPCFSTTCNINITDFRRFVQSGNYRFFITISHAISCAVNSIPELRQRLIEGELYEFDRIDPGYTVLLKDNTFSFCDSVFFEEFKEYYDYSLSKIESVKEEPDHSTGEKQHMFFITNIPWFSFTSFTHPYDEQYGSIPVITIGKYFTQGKNTYIPLAVQVHHGIVDGFHIGLFFERLAHILKYFPIAG
jgi:chloramphenicol O-acetyltransferase type A